MKAALACLFFALAAQAAPVDEVVPPLPVTEIPSVIGVVDEVRAEQNSQDPSVLLSEPIDKATKLIIDLDDHIRKYLPVEDEAITTVAPAQVYASGDVPDGELSVVERQSQMQSLIDQVNRLAESIENTITDLVARRRYVTAAMLRSMLNYVRRVRINLERLQNRLTSVQQVASVGQAASAPVGPQQGSVNQSNVPGAQFITTIRDRVNTITAEISSLVTRIRGSFTPGINPAVPGGPLPALSTSSPGQLNGGGLIAAVGDGVNAVAEAVDAVAAAGSN